MEVHRTLTVTGSRAALDRVVADLLRRATGEWSRDRNREQQLESGSIGNDPIPMYCFVCTERPGRRRAVLWLASGPTDLRVSQIQPCDRRDMTIPECNAVLTDFHDTLVVPAVEGVGVDVQFGGGDVGIEEWLTKDTAALLRRFSLAANKATGSTHLLDFNRWAAFLIAAHKDLAELLPEQLERWLCEQGWSLDKAQELALQYAFARKLLRAYDEGRKA